MSCSSLSVDWSVVDSFDIFLKLITIMIVAVVITIIIMIPMAPITPQRMYPLTINWLIDAACGIIIRRKTVCIIIIVSYSYIPICLVNVPSITAMSVPVDAVAVK